MELKDGVKKEDVSFELGLSGVVDYELNEAINITGLKDAVNNLKLRLPQKTPMKQNLN
ncbi:hypothetical protein ACQKMN_15800 [Ureibacillus composti]